MALHFGEVSLASLPANLLAAPAIAPVMWLGVLAAAAAQVAEPLAAPFSALTGPLLVYLQTVARLTARRRRSPSSSVDASPAAIAAAGVAVATGGFAARRCRRSRRAGRASPPARRRTRRLVAALVRSPWRLLAIAGGVRGDATLPTAAGGRAARVVPGHRPGRRDVDRARRHEGARRHGAARRADTRAPRGGRRQAARRADADPRRGGPRGRRARGDRASQAAADRRWRQPAGLRPCSACSRPPRRRRARGG